MRNCIENLPEEYFVLGDAAFMGLRNIRVAHSTAEFPLTSEEEYNLKRQRIIVENAFGLFKGKFKRFAGRVINGHTNNSIKTIKVAFWLHNFIIDNN